MDKKMIVGFDLDGVLVNIPFYNFCEKFKLNYVFARHLRKLYFMNFSFHRWFLRVNFKIAGILRQMDRDRHNIVIISGRSVEDGKLISAFLERNKLPVHELRLMNVVCPSDGYYFQFKLSQIVELDCDFYIEDREDMVNFLRQELGGVCQVIHFRNDPLSFLEIERALKII